MACEPCPFRRQPHGAMRPGQEPSPEFVTAENVAAGGVGWDTRWDRPCRKTMPVCREIGLPEIKAGSPENKPGTLRKKAAQKSRLDDVRQGGTNHSRHVAPARSLC
jgi:hypothetical protein